MNMNKTFIAGLLGLTMAAACGRAPESRVENRVAPSPEQAAAASSNDLNPPPVFKSVSVLFAINSAELNPESKNVLRTLANEVRLNPCKILDVSGYASADGGAEHNLRLSRERAQAVVNFLSSQLGSGWSVRTAGYGKDGLRVTNAPEENNRRVVATAGALEGCTIQP